MYVDVCDDAFEGQPQLYRANHSHARERSGHIVREKEVDKQKPEAVRELLVSPYHGKSLTAWTEIQRLQLSQR